MTNNEISKLENGDTTVSVNFNELEILRLMALVQKSGMTINEYFRRAVGF